MIGYNLMGEPISGSQELSFKFGWGKKKKKSAWLNLALSKIYIIYDSKKMIGILSLQSSDSPLKEGDCRTAWDILNSLLRNSNQVFWIVKQAISHYPWHHINEHVIRM